jgi:hypothetical protein
MLLDLALHTAKEMPSKSYMRFEMTANRSMSEATLIGRAQVTSLLLRGHDEVHPACRAAPTGPKRKRSLVVALDRSLILVPHYTIDAWWLFLHFRFGPCRVSTPTSGEVATGLSVHVPACTMPAF